MADLDITGRVSLDASQAESALDGVGRKAGKFALDMTQAGEKAGKAVAQIGDIANANGDKFTRSEASIVNSIKRLASEAAKAQPVLDKLGDIQFNIAAKGLDAAKFAPYLDVIKSVSKEAQDSVNTLAVTSTRATTTATASLNKMGVSAAQTAAALRGVPAQFTDIVTSLQGGQAPLTVFLQQGGQLKDMFGGAGNAARALGGYVLGLVNPFTLAAGAAAVLGLAYFQGSKEADAYNKALVTTGNASGTTAAQMQQMAQRISTVVGTQGAAAATLAQLAGSSRVAAENFEYFGTVALKVEKTVGTAVADTVKQFAELGKSPVEASKKLNEETNYLTQAIYEQIKALKDQGKEAAAASLAQNTYADALNNQTARITQNLGYLQTAWQGVASFAKRGWDAMLNVGRSDSLGDQLAQVRAQLEARMVRQNGRPDFFDEKGNEKLRQQIGLLTEQERLLKRGSEAQAQRAQVEKAAIEATDALGKANEKALSKQEQMNKALADYRGNLEKVKAVNPNSALLDPAQVAKSEKAIREQFAERTGVVAAGNKELRDQQRIFAELAGVSSTYYSEIANFQKQRAAGVVTEKQYVEAVEKLIQKQPFAVALAKEQADAEKERAKSAAELAKTLEAYAKAQQEGVAQGFQAAQQAEEQLAQYGMLKSEVQALTLAYLEQSRESAALAGEDVSNIDKRIAAQKRLINATRGLEAREIANSAAKSAAEEWKRTAESINQSLTDALLRGFESGKDFAKNLRDTLVNMFKTLVLRPVISAVINPISAGLTGSLGLSGAANAATGGGALGGLSNLSTVYNIGSAALTGVGTAVAGAIGSTVSTFLGSTAGNAAISAALGYGSGAATAAATGAAVAGGASAATAAASAASGSGLVATAAAAAPVVVAALLVANALGLFRTTKTVDGGISGTLGVGTINDYDVNRKSGTLFRGPSYSVQDAGIASQSEAIQTAYKAVRAVTADMADTLGVGSDAIRNFTTRLGNDLISADNGDARGIKLDGLSGEQAAAKIQEALAAANNALAAQVLAGTEFARTGETSVDTLARLSGSLKAVNSTFDLLGLSLIDASLAGGNIASSLVDAFGGLENLAAATSTYYDNFYSEAEKTANVTNQVTAALAAVGLELPKTREEFRALVEAQAELGTEGQGAYATLLQLSGVFASFTAVTEQASTALTKAQQDLTDQLAVLTGAETARSLALRDAADDTTRALLEQINAQQDLNAATEAAAAATRALAGINQGVQDQIDLITGAQTERSLQLRDATDATTKALLEQLFAQQDLAAAADIAPQVDAAAQSLNNLGNVLSRFGDTLNLRADVLKRGAATQGPTPTLALSESRGFNDPGVYFEKTLAQWIQDDADLIEGYVNDQNAVIERARARFASAGSPGGAKGLEDYLREISQNVDTNAQATVVPRFKESLTKRTAQFESFFADLGAFAKQLETNLATSADSAIGATLQLGSIATYFGDLATEITSIESLLKTTAGKAGVGFDATKFATEIASGAGAISSVITASILAKVPEALKNDPALAGVSTTILSILGSVGKDDVQGLNDGFLLLSGSLTRGELTSAQYATAIEYLTGAFKGAGDAAKEIADKIDDGFAKSTDAAYASLQRAVDAQRKVLSTQLEAAQSLATEVGSIFDTLQSSVKDLYGSVENAAKQSAVQARSFISNALTGARATGSLPDGNALKDAIQAATSGINAGQYATSADQDFERLVLANQLSSLKDIAGDQLSEAERQIKVLKDQLDSLDKVLQTARDQIDALRGIDVSVISVGAAVANLATAVAAESEAIRALAAAATAAATRPPAVVPGVVVPAGTTGGATGGLPGYTSAGSAFGTELFSLPNGTVADAATIAQLEQLFGGVPKFAVGTNYVPRDMLAQIHEGEAIVPKAYNPAANPGSGNARLETLVAGMTAELIELRKQVDVTNRNTQRTAEAVNGNPDAPILVQTV